ncbi:hypothetical protein [Pseudomonas arsenicoxydans]|uniref:Uncharacterized protein n=1 Tax=Pseudomonas arsenicoxydans TaxID=702115 RepID=A0A502HT79_9PSED|nr:hypothetical protein [Pseudomonas arsenicoxydans]TPG76310.1 hypothetical protein EAH78_18275 [Pseudomonas arsenicoxydans]
MSKSFDFILTKPLQIAEKGETVECSLICFNEPTGKVAAKVSGLNSIYTAAVMRMVESMKERGERPDPEDAEKKSVAEERESSIAAARLAFYMGNGDGEVLTEKFIALLTAPGFASIDGRIPISSFHVNTMMSAEDIDEMMFDFLSRSGKLSR